MHPPIVRTLFDSKLDPGFLTFTPTTVCSPIFFLVWATIRNIRSGFTLEVEYSILKR